MRFTMTWTWKLHADGERRGGMKAHAFEDSTRRSLCRKYDDGPAWGLAPCGAGGRILPRHRCCQTCWMEAERAHLPAPLDLPTKGA